MTCFLLRLPSTCICTCAKVTYSRRLHSCARRCSRGGGDHAEPCPTRGQPGAAGAPPPSVSSAPATENSFCRGRSGRVQSSPLAGDPWAYVKGDRVWQRTTVYVSGRQAGGYGIARMLGSRGYVSAPLFHSTVEYRR